MYDDDTACSMPSLLQMFLNLSVIKVSPASETIMQDSLYSEKIVLHFFYYIICPEPFHNFHNLVFAVEIYNTKIMLNITCKDVSSNRFPWPSWYFL